MEFESSSRPRHLGMWALAAAIALATFALSAYPMYVIRPFRGQQPAELAAALSVKAWGPYAAWILAAAGVALASLLWRKSSRWGAAALGALTVVFAGLTHVNVYEIMFKPAGAPGFVAAAQAQVDPGDMVLAIAVGREPRAYPIRTMGYHHIINDWVGGKAVVTTY